MKRVLLVALFAILAVPLFAQEVTITAPYVSRLRTSVEGSYIKVLWKDSNLPGAKYVIYRSTTPIDSTTFAGARKLATVPAGQESFVDQPPAGGPYYYAVLVLDQKGQIRALFIPFRNITSVGVSPAPAAAAGAGYASIEGLRASRSGDTVTLRFSSSLPDHELLIYRATSPVVTSRDLATAVAVGDLSGGTTSFTDTPVPGIPYYYAVIDSAMLRNGSIVLTPGENTTRTPVEVPLPAAMAEPKLYATPRPQPLPLLRLTTNPVTGTPLPPSAVASASKKIELSPAAQADVAALLSGLPAATSPQLAIIVLDPEKGVVAQTGEEISLKAIVDGPLEGRDWPVAEKRFDDFLSIPRAQAIEQRARFYLGQAYYFQRDYRRAFLEFLIAEKGLYTEVQPWMNEIFDRLQGK